MRISHVITGLGVGGAEMTLYKLLSRTVEGPDVHEVICLKGEGEVFAAIRQLGVRVTALSATSRVQGVWNVPRLMVALAQSRPTVVQTWMYHADLLGGLAARCVTSCPVVWNIRASRLDGIGVKRSTKAVIRVCARLSSRIPTAIVCNSEAGRLEHQRLGYHAERILVIPNGFDTSTFQPNDQARADVRREFRIPEDALVIGMVARLDPLKDHETLFRAARVLHARHPEVYWLLVGSGVTPDNTTIAELVTPTGASERIRLAGYRADIARMTAAFDIATCCSSTEGFPNVVAEAMACGIPCVVTDVGESAAILGKAGLVVPPSQPERLAEAWASLIDRGEQHRRELGVKARERVIQEYSIDAMVQRYEAVYRDAVARTRPASGVATIRS